MKIKKITYTFIDATNIIYGAHNAGWADIEDIKGHLIFKKAKKMG